MEKPRILIADKLHNKYLKMLGKLQKNVELCSSYAMLYLDKAITLHLLFIRFNNRQNKGTKSDFVLVK